MAVITEVRDPDDPRLGDHTRLRDVQLRRHLEAERGLFIGEGEKVVRRAVEAGCRPRSFLMAERWLAGLGDVLGSAPDVPCYLVTEELAERLTGFHVHRGALASLHRPSPPTTDQVVATARRVAVLEDIVDHANVGAVFRSAAALGVHGILVTPRCADPLYRRSIKVSMGAVFDVPWARIETWPAAIASLRADGFTVVALTLAQDSISLDEFAAQQHHEKLVWVLGTEGQGVQARTAAAADVRVRIPMDAGVDSLNVAAAAAVAFYATRLRVTSKSTPPWWRGVVRLRPDAQSPR